MQISPQAIGKRIAERRAALGMTQRHLAPRVMRSRGWLAKIETGDLSPTRSMLPVLAGALLLTVDELVDGTDWTGSTVRRSAGGRSARRTRRRPFAHASGPFDRRRRLGKRRRALYVDYSRTALLLGRLLRCRSDLNWRTVLKVRVTTPGEALFVVHALSLGSQVECWSPLEMRLRIMVTETSAPPIYTGDRRRWCLRARVADLDVILFSQIGFVGLSGAVYRADFVLGAARNGRVVWLLVEVDEPYHELQARKDGWRDEDSPLETIRIPEARLLDEGLFGELLATARSRLDAPTDVAA